MRRAELKQSLAAPGVYGRGKPVCNVQRSYQNDHEDYKSSDNSHVSVPFLRPVKEEATIHLRNLVDLDKQLDAVLDEAANRNANIYRILARNSAPLHGLRRCLITSCASVSLHTASASHPRQDLCRLAHLTQTAHFASPTPNVEEQLSVDLPVTSKASLLACIYV